MSSHTETIIRDAIDALGMPLHVSNRSFVITCPTCGKAKKYWIERTTGRGICFVCGLKSSAPYTLRLLTGCSLEAARDTLSWGEVVQHGDLSCSFDLFNAPHEKLPADPPIALGLSFPRVTGVDPGSLYAISRGVRVEDLKKFDCRYNLYMQRLVFPVYSMSGDIVGWQGRDWTGKQELKALSSTFKKSQNLLGIQLIPHHSSIAICEGPFDMLKLSQVVPTVCSFGKYVSFAQLEMLMSLQPTCIYICLDRDAQAEATELAFQFGSISRVAPPPVPYKDYGECPVEEIQASLDASVPYTPLSFIPDLFT